MRYALSLNFEGSVSVERGTDGCRLLSLAGSGGPPESTDPWQIVLRYEYASEPQQSVSAGLEIAGPMNGMLRGSLQQSETNFLSNGAGVDKACVIDLGFTVTGASGWFTGSRGSVRLHGTLVPPDFLATADLDLDAPSDAWVPPNGGLLSVMEDASGGSHVGPQPLAQREAEVEAVRRIRRQAAVHGAARERSYTWSVPLGRPPTEMRGEMDMAEFSQERHDPPGVTTGSSERPPQTLAGSALTFDLEAELEAIKRERSWIEGDRNAKTLVKEADFRAVLVALKAGARMPQHEADARLTLQTLRGELRVRLPAELVTLPAGHLLALDRDVAHEVEATEESAFLLTLALSQEKVRSA